MKTANFFTTTFLNACERELESIKNELWFNENSNLPNFYKNDNAYQMKQYYNRLAYLLTVGGRWSKEKFIEETYIIGDWHIMAFDFVD